MRNHTKNEVLFDGGLGRLRPLSPTPQLSSSALGWRGYQLEQHQLPSIHARDVVWMRTAVILQLNQPVTLQVQNDNEYLPKRILPGQFSLRPFQSRTSVRCDENVEFLTVLLEPGFVQAACVEVFDKDPELLLLHGIKDPFVRGICLALLDEVMHNGRSGRLYSDSLATSLAIHLSSRYARSTNDRLSSPSHLHPLKVRQAMELIGNQLAHDLTLKDIASAVRLSPFHFARIFKRTTGMSPHQYLIRQRVERARKLMLRGNLSLADVARESGFCDQSHLTVHFKRVCGLTPKAYATQSHACATIA